MHDQEKAGHIKPNILYYIKHLSSGRFLRFVDSGVLQCYHNMPEDKRQYFQWYVQPSKPDNHYYLRNTITKGYAAIIPGIKIFSYIYGAKEPDYMNQCEWQVMMSKQRPKECYIQSQSKRYAKAHSNPQGNNQVYLKPVHVWEKDLHPDQDDKWEFIPVNSQLKVHLTSFIFESPDDIIKRSQKFIKKDFINKTDFEVTKETVGSEIQISFTKTITTSYSFEFTQKYGVKATMQAEIKIPFVGNTKIGVETNAEWGSNENNGKQTSYEISLTPTLKVSEPGKYRITGWADIVEDVQMPFTAKAKFTAKGLGYINGNYVESYDFPSDYIESLMAQSQDYKDHKAISKDEKSVTVQVSGKISGSFGFKSDFSTEKIN